MFDAWSDIDCEPAERDNNYLCCKCWARRVYCYPEHSRCQDKLSGDDICSYYILRLTVTEHIENHLILKYRYSINIVLNITLGI
jgi:hypothetical protein